MRAGDHREPHEARDQLSQVRTSKTTTGIDPPLNRFTAMDRSRKDLEAGVVISAPDFAGTFDFLTGIGFRVEEIFPADAPHRAILVGFGTRLFLEVGPPSDVVVRLRTWDGRHETLLAPNGSRIEFVPVVHEVSRPALRSSLVVTPGDGTWHQGRAGMFYRDLVPDRQGDCVIASHIRIPEGGPVPDYVHFHEVGFQLIFCHKGWVEVAYEGQGEPFVLRAGDCVIQPPRIRHRVLSSSDEMHVVEIGYPAEHVTKADPSTTLPSSSLPPEHEWSGQRFVHFRDDEAKWEPSGEIAIADTGISRGTRGLADVRVASGATNTRWSSSETPSGTFRMVFVLSGHIEAQVAGRQVEAVESTTFTIPEGSAAQFAFRSESRLLLVDVVTT